MKNGKIAMVCFIMALALPSFASRKAKVITVSGKKWDVVFLKMSNDTLYLKGFKPNGDLFSVSGHKSRFKQVEFSDASQLDLSLSDFPPSEDGRRASNGEIVQSDSRDAVSLPPPSSQKDWNTTYTFPDPLHEDDPPAATGVSSQGPSGINPDGIDHRAPAAAALAMRQETEISPGKSAIELSATAPIETKSLSDPIPPEKPQQPSVVMVKKRGSAFARTLFGLSVASLAGSGVAYYFYRKDHWKEEETFATLDNAAVKGPSTIDVLSQNKDQHLQSQTRLTISQILLGAGGAFLAADIVFYF